jgi:hypothetical protein
VVWDSSAYRVLMKKHEEKRLLGKHKGSLEDIKVYLKRYGMKGCGLGQWWVL